MHGFYFVLFNLLLYYCNWFYVFYNKYPILIDLGKRYLVQNYVLLLIFVLSDLMKIRNFVYFNTSIPDHGVFCDNTNIYMQYWQQITFRISL